MQFNWKFNCFCGRPFYLFTWVCMCGVIFPLFSWLVFVPWPFIDVCRALNLDVSCIEICHWSHSIAVWLCCFNYLRLYLFKYLPIQLGCAHFFPDPDPVSCNLLFNWRAIGDVSDDHNWLHCSSHSFGIVSINIMSDRTDTNISADIDATQAIS